eukprot:1254432-Amphidinium_carterae.1
MSAHCNCECLCFTSTHVTVRPFRPTLLVRETLVLAAAHTRNTKTCLGFPIQKLIYTSIAPQSNFPPC